jgi:hypothetical protein
MRRWVMVVGLKSLVLAFSSLMFAMLASCKQGPSACDVRINKRDAMKVAVTDFRQSWNQSVERKDGPPILKQNCCVFKEVNYRSDSVWRSLLTLDDIPDAFVIVIEALNSDRSIVGSGYYHISECGKSVEPEFVVSNLRG